VFLIVIRKNILKINFTIIKKKNKIASLIVNALYLSKKSSKNLVDLEAIKRILYKKRPTHPS